MRVQECPKKLNHCHEQCPMYPCWAYDKHMQEQEKKKFDGWE